jgi:filamentous hemagglutinin family protein
MMKTSRTKHWAKIHNSDSAGLVLPLRCEKVSPALGGVLHSKYTLPALAITVPGLVVASPQGGDVVAGNVTIEYDATSTVISQTTDQSIINWQSFSIGQQEYVQFIQPSSSSISLNRVVGGDPSSILGRLDANGHVFLVNPNGIYFGPNARVDVSGIVASVLDLRNEDFLSGNYVFTRGSGNTQSASVVNDGLIRARENGYVVLVGDYTQNTGIIESKLGTVVLASGSKLTLDLADDGLVSIVVNEATVSAMAGVENSGELLAEGGRVLLSANIANDLIETAVNNSGLIKATGIKESNGEIYLIGRGGDVVNEGIIDASAATGEVGNKVRDGGGVLVYSDKDVILTDGSKIKAEGNSRKGKGGTVRTIAEQRLDFQSGASISVGGAEGKGGFVELSGHGGFSIRGDLDLGEGGGEVLIDPSTLTILNGASSPSGTATGNVGNLFIEGQLNLGNDVTLVASSSIGATTTMSINANSAGAGDLNILIGTVAGGGTLGGPTGSNDCGFAGFCMPGGVGTFNVTPTTTGNINLGNVSFNLAGGLNVAGGTTAGSVSIGAINAGGNVSITAGTDVWLVGNISGAGTNLAVSAGGNINVDILGGIGSSGGLLAADVALTAGNDINIDGDIYLANKTLTLAGGSGATDTVSIINASDNRTINVVTQGLLSITGNNLVVQNALTGFSGTTFSSVNVDAGTIDVAITGNMDVIGGSFTAGGAGSPVSVDASVSAVNNISITAQNLSVNAGNVSVTASGGGSPNPVTANAKLGAGGNITVNVAGAFNVSAGNAFANAPGATSTAAAAEANAEVVAGGNVDITAGNVSINGGVAFTSGAGTVAASANANLTAGAALSVVASTNVIGNSADISAAGMYVAAGNNINLQTSNITVGSGTVAGISGDVFLRQIMQVNGIPLSTTANPNAKFVAGGNLDLGTITMQGDVPYLWMSAANTTIAGLDLPTATNVLVQYSPIDPTVTIGVEDTADLSRTVNYNNLAHFQVLPGTTVAIGSSQQTGDIFVGQNGDIDIGNQNMIFLTLGNVDSIDNVISNGVVTMLSTEGFITPRLGNISVWGGDGPETDDEEDDDLITHKKESSAGMCKAI